MFGDEKIVLKIHLIIFCTRRPGQLSKTFIITGSMMTNRINRGMKL